MVWPFTTERVREIKALSTGKTLCHHQNSLYFSQFSASSQMLYSNRHQIIHHGLTIRADSPHSTVSKHETFPCLGNCRAPRAFRPKVSEGAGHTNCDIASTRKRPCHPTDLSYSANQISDNIHPSNLAPLVCIDRRPSVACEPTCPCLTLFTGARLTRS
jgi:hypothetical protein